MCIIVNHQMSSGRLDLLYMDINLVTISKLSSEIIDREKFTLMNYKSGDFQELRNIIYDKFPSLFLSDDYRIFWQYSEDTFLEIYNVITYSAAIKCMATYTFYILIDDFEEIWDDNLTFLLDLDRIEEEERKERERDIYDVKIVKKVEKPESVASAEESLPKIPRKIRTESEILSYAIRNEPKPFYYMNDSMLESNLIRDLQKGYPKVKVKLRILPDIEFEKRGPKDRKGKKGKGKGKGKVKGKGKDKGKGKAKGKKKK